LTPERWRQVEEIFQTALDLAPAERPQYIERACAGDARLRDDVVAMLEQHQRAEQVDGFLEATLDAGNALHGLAALMDRHADSMLGQHVGAYRVIREIGRGGMGAVYLAERADHAFQRQVAIKVIKRGMDTDFILRRFQQERRILAALDHPHIARLLDGGATGGGQPYFVMEYIEGQPLYEYCDTRRMGVRERLRLFCRVCEAVEYAHQNQVVHRDIKPSNILVPASGVPKLFDFGIAKLLDPELTSDTAPQTATAMRMMTIEYASPEQVQGLPVTFLSDVYSLGVLLYELLTGHRPYSFGNHSLHEAVRAICEEQPERPSVAIARPDNLLPSPSADGEATTVTRLCELRGQTLESLRHELSAGPDQIVLQALRKAPAERYQSVAALRDDIMGFLDGRPVHASLHIAAAPGGAAPATAVAARDVTTSIAVLPLELLNVSAAGDTDDTYLSIGLADALITRLSNVRSLTVRPTSSVMRYGGEGADPLAAGSELKVDFVLDGRVKRAGERIRVSLQLLDVRNHRSAWAHQFDQRFTDVLELEDVISAQVAEALVPRLTGDERRKLEKRGTDVPEAYEAYLRGRHFWNQCSNESMPKAIASLQRAIALDPDYALAHAGLADSYNWTSILGVLPAQECRREAGAAARRALELDDSLGEPHAALAFLSAFAESDWMNGERQLKRALELNPSYALAHEWYSTLLMGTGRLEEGLEEIRRAEELDPVSLRAMTLTAWTLYQARRYDEAAEKARQLIEMDRNFWQGYVQLGNALVETGRADEAVDLLQHAARLLPDSGVTMFTLCHALVAAHRLEEAQAVLDRLLAAAATRYIKPYFVAMALVALDQRDAAFEWFEKALAEEGGWLVWLATEPKLDRLRDDERFDDLLQRTNRPPRRAARPQGENR
jgi:serine/threonine protein kinase/tetratricopeptide (TPR) repeat protein